MSKRLQKIDPVYLLWVAGMLVFLFCMLDRYCRMVYGGTIFYVLSGGNEISEEEQRLLNERGPLVYGETLDSFPAQLFEDSLNNQNGFAVDLMDQLSLEMGVKMVFQPVEWPEIFKRLENKEVDIIQITYSEERAEEYYLTAPVYQNRGVVFLQNEGEEVRTLAELGERTLAGIQEDYVLSVLRTNYPKIQIVECSNIEECAEKLRNHEADGIAADEQNLMYYVQGEKLFQDGYMVEESVYEADVVFALRKSDAQLGQILDKAVYQLRNKDILAQLQKKWFLTSVLQDALPVRNLYLWGAELGIGTVGLYAVLLWYIQFRTKRLVELRTKDLDKERRRVQTILESIPQYVLEVNKEGEILTINRQEAEVSETEKPVFFDHINQKLSSPEIMDILQEVQQKGHAQREMEIEGRWYHIIGNDIHKKQTDGQILLVAEDVTRSRIQERKNIQNEKMIAIGHLASGVSHELKNPLEIICNYCYAIRNGILKTQEEMIEVAGVIEEEAKAANRIVESLLSFARVVPKEIRRTDLKAVLEMILRLQETVLQKKKIQAQLTCEEALFVSCNPDYVKQIVINLLMNAAEAMSGEEREKRIDITAVKEADYVKMEIQDTGVGMSEQEIEKIFNPFYTTKASGTGLGLYLVYQQIHEIGGDIQVFSRKGEGTLFRVCFPL